jgi:site-specific DNA-methyltransferase (adenine-specific)
MKQINDKSIDMILCDLPYGATECKLDGVIPFDVLWEQYERIIKDKGAIVLTAMQPFTTALISSNIKLFKYCWVWNKKLAGNFMTAKVRPLIVHEDICVFSKGVTANGSKRNMIYNPQMEVRDKPRKYKMGNKSELYNRDNMNPNIEYESNYRYPKSIIDAPNTDRKSKIHPTQKPVDLCEYLINTYSNENDLILDFTCGSGSTLIAAKNLKRKCFGIELEDKYCEIAKKRLSE